MPWTGFKSNNKCYETLFFLKELHQVRLRKTKLNTTQEQHISGYFDSNVPLISNPNGIKLPTVFRKPTKPCCTASMSTMASPTCVIIGGGVFAKNSANSSSPPSSKLIMKNLTVTRKSAETSLKMYGPMKVGDCVASWILMEQLYTLVR